MVGSGTPSSYDEWVKTEGGLEHPTHMETLETPEQQARIEWLVRHTFPSMSILDVGCNRGYVLYKMANRREGKFCGVDINIENIELAMRTYYWIHFCQMDVLDGLQFDDNSYNIVVMADILEHLPSDKMDYAIQEGLRVAKDKLLITIPYRQDLATCFKHQWQPNPVALGMVHARLAMLAARTMSECDGNFYYLEAFVD